MILRSALVLAALSTPALAVDYRWTVGTGQGTVEAGIRNRGGGRFTIFCAAGQPDRGAGIMLDGPAGTGEKGKPVDVQVVVDGKSHAFAVTDGYGPVAARGARLDLANLSRALLASRAKRFTVEYPGLGRAENFSLLGVRDALAERGGTIVAPCI